MYFSQVVSKALDVFLILFLSNLTYFYSVEKNDEQVETITCRGKVFVIMKPYNAGGLFPK